MKYHVYQPSSVLKPYVRFFWTLESDNPDYIHRSMADTCPELLFHYNGRFDEVKRCGSREKSFVSGVHGQSRTVRRFYINKSFGIVGVYLYPYAIPLLFGFSAGNISDQMPDLYELLGRDGVDLEEQIILALDNAERIARLSQYLEKKISHISPPSHPVFAAIQFVINTGGRVKVEEAAAQFSLSERQFERKFKEYAGFSPKLFARIARFHSALEEFASPDKSLTEIALACGYYDQSHFIHDFKEFSGHNPKAWFSGKAEGQEWSSVNAVARS